MDILNWLYLKKQQLIKKVFNDPKTDLIILGAEVPPTQRGDLYQSYGITVEDFAANLRPYKVYTALLTQSGTDAPVATVLENTLGNNGIWGRTSLGTYNLNINGVFIENKTMCFVTQANGCNNAAIFFFSRTNDDYVVLDCIDPYTPGVFRVDPQGVIQVEIRVYN